MGRVFGLEGMGRHASGPLLRLHRDGWLSWRVAKEAPYPLTAARLFPIHTEFPAWMGHQKRFGAQKSSRAVGMAGQGIRGKAPVRPVVAARATQAAGRTGGVFFAGRSIPGRRERQADAWPWPVFGLCWPHEYAQPIISRAPTFRASCFRGAGNAGSRPGQNGPGQESGTAGTCRRGGPCPAPLAAGAPGTAARGTAAGAGVSGSSLARPAPFGPAQRRFQRAGGGA